MKESSLYERVALEFAADINEIFSSEETLKLTFEEFFPGMEFDRTDHWDSILRCQFSQCWKQYGPAVVSEPTQTDIEKMLVHLYNHLDYNLFTQVLLNLQSYMGFAYAAPEAIKCLSEMEAKWTDKKVDVTPFTPKAKMFKQAGTDFEKEFNVDLSSIKALNIIKGFTPLNSFRVSPKGSTPALVDSRNLSMLGIGGDRFVKTMQGWRVDYFVWQKAPRVIDLVKVLVPDALAPSTLRFRAEGIPYCFESKSGGDILNDVLFARKVAATIYFLSVTANFHTIILPRLNSVLVVSPEGNQTQLMFEHLRRQFPLELHEGQRKY